MRSVGILLIEIAQDGREELREHRTRILRVGDEDTRVPHKLAAVHEHLSKLTVRLLREAPHLIDAAFHEAVGLDIAITGLRARRLDSHSEEGIVSGGKGHGFSDILLEHLIVEDELVTGYDDHHRIIIDF